MVVNDIRVEKMGFSVLLLREERFAEVGKRENLITKGNGYIDLTPL